MIGKIVLYSLASCGGIAILIVFGIIGWLFFFDWLVDRRPKEKATIAERMEPARTLEELKAEWAMKAGKDH